MSSNSIRNTELALSTPILDQNHPEISPVHYGTVQYAVNIVQYVRTYGPI